jgi:hypothetical protein
VALLIPRRRQLIASLPPLRSFFLERECRRDYFVIEYIFLKVAFLIFEKYSINGAYLSFGKSHRKVKYVVILHMACVAVHNVHAR